ncbi:MAG: hypothetical protein LH679_15360 [Cyanobacteria bacterium CAN_BIN43]|nr:hypothetical protein [Cyanobacteria bacterium CAN_BIN43]
MAIARKPKPSNVDDFILQGGSVPEVATKPLSEEEVKGLKLRLPVDLLKRVDESVANRRPAPSRHQWILEAIYKKLNEEVEELMLQKIKLD